MSGMVLWTDEQCPARLQVLARAVVRGGMRAALLARHPHLREPPPRRPQPASSCPRRICIPIEDDSDVGTSCYIPILLTRKLYSHALQSDTIIYVNLLSLINFYFYRRPQCIARFG